MHKKQKRELKNSEQYSSKYKILKISSTELVAFYFPFLYPHEFFMSPKKFKNVSLRDLPKVFY